MDQKIKYHETSIKGSFPSTFRDNVIKKGYTDVGPRVYGNIIFKGTDDEYDEFYDKNLMGDERYFKVIGIKTFSLAGYDEAGKLIISKDFKMNIK